MKQMHIILLEDPQKSGTPQDTIFVYTARHGSKNDALLRMHMQGILPRYSVVSHSVMPVTKTLMNTMFPSLQVIRHQFGKLTVLTFLKYWIILPLSKIFRGSTRKQWQQIGEFDTKTKRVYAVPDEESSKKS